MSHLPQRKEKVASIVERQLLVNIAIIAGKKILNISTLSIFQI